MRDELDGIRAAGAELVVIGSGTAWHAAAFRREQGLDLPLLVDPELEAYRAAGLRRGAKHVLRPRVLKHAVRAWRSGARQARPQGDPWQLGGVFVLGRGGEVRYAHISREAGDHPPIAEVLAALPAPGVLEETA